MNKKILPLLGGLFLLLASGKCWAWQTNPAEYSAGVPNNIFSASTATAISSIGGSVSTQSVTGLILTNPIGSGKVLQLLDIRVAMSNLSASTATFTLMGNVVTQTVTTVLSSTVQVVNTDLQDLTPSVALADVSGIIGNLSLIEYIGTSGSINSFIPYIDDPVNGNISLKPGTSVVIQTTGSATSPGVTIKWQELNQ